MKQLTFRLLLLSAVILLAFAGAAQDGQALFQTYCSACHTIGGGKRVGPDLINLLDRRSPEWSVAFIQSSQKMIKAGDAQAVKVFSEYNQIPMPDQPLDNGQAMAVIDHITSVSKNAASASSGGVPTAPPPDLLASATAENVMSGLMLFTGRQRLTNGGPSCGACHTVNDNRAFTSGNLAKELTRSYEIMGSAGVAAILKNSPFPVMTRAYVFTPLTDEEILDLTAYLRSVSEERLYQVPRVYSFLFGIAGFIVFLGSLKLIYILYFKRKTLAVNHNIFKRQLQTIN